MYVIGINGSSCAGKTTFSRYLFKNERRKVIHLDRIFNTIKKELFKNSTLNLKTLNGENLVFINPNTNVKKILDYKRIRRMYNFLKELYAKQIIEYFLKYYNDYDYLIIEGYFLDELDLEKYCDELIYVYADEERRKQRYLKRNKIGRNGLTDSENILILNSFNNVSKCVDFSKYVVINNNGSKDIFKNSLMKIEEYIEKNVKSNEKQKSLKKSRCSDLPKFK